MNGAHSLEDESEIIKSSFITSEGIYRLVMTPEFSGSGRSSLNAVSVPSSAPPVRVSFLGNMMTFNFGRELFVYPYNNGSILEKPLDKRVYKGTCPTCHDFASEEEEEEEEESLSLLVKWLPGTRDLFLSSHASGHIYVYNRDLPCNLSAPTYSLLKKGDGFSVYTQTKTGKGSPSKNPICKWSIGKGSVNEFAFSPCARYLAVVGQDGYLRIFNYDAMECVGLARSYFGGLLCVSWSPDGKYIVCGGEDDLVTVYSFLEKRVVVRGQGHKSWVSVVAFDPYMSFGEVPDGFDLSASEEDRDEEDKDILKGSPTGITVSSGVLSGVSSASCHSGKSNASSPNSSLGALTNASHTSTSFSVSSKDSGVITDAASSSSNHTSLTHRLASLNFGGGDKKDKKSGGISSKSSSRSSSASVSMNTCGSSCHDRYPEETIKLGSQQCPRIYEIPVIEPLVSKKVAHERLTALVFREEYLVTACQDGFVRTWARPGKMNVGNANSLCPESPPRSSTSLSSSTCCNNNNPGSVSTTVDGTIV
ncbi:Dystrophia myotonica WD repeat-containing protein,Catabolite repression protein creC,Probable catabolite repression protein creC [Lepeophtheirus salmonis]|uniref:Dystrophia myotonica WD repeat-containing protein,Catabolite repression protein creC,Probable catabolite repression protein creC n=1 Tax=Lepeophtheirus salmonis TaxID=72036 RepID=A0A7R8D6E4_LEPSM|nr:Dystrophia myotonica WD repeat-containing protein,Catabolite repression protein creC,Probable catabolite repression protein creC [Lepeophtheirus salmonis]CAF3016782.1 Dystrophia myotonica WD repeat-containing protein,Catabolite repression protein creC,Probable catabolite repression protein creC [Lepeophtheirus salmonis]